MCVCVCVCVCLRVYICVVCVGMCCVSVCTYACIRVLFLSLSLFVCLSSYMCCVCTCLHAPLSWRSDMGRAAQTRACSVHPPTPSPAYESCNTYITDTWAGMDNRSWIQQKAKSELERHRGNNSYARPPKRPGLGWVWQGFPDYRTWWRHSAAAYTPLPPAKLHIIRSSYTHTHIYLFTNAREVNVY